MNVNRKRDWLSLQLLFYITGNRCRLLCIAYWLILILYQLWHCDWHFFVRLRILEKEIEQKRKKKLSSISLFRRAIIIVHVLYQYNFISIRYKTNMLLNNNIWLVHCYLHNFYIVHRLYNVKKGGGETDILSWGDVYLGK